MSSSVRSQAAVIRDFEIDHRDACEALGLSPDALVGKPLVYHLHGDGRRVSWAVDIVNLLRLKSPRRALAKMRLHTLAR